MIYNLSDLKAALNACKTRKDFIAVAKNLELGKSGLENIASWNPEHYTRNCAIRTDEYELLLLCWEPGQDTPIHCHSGEECWVYMVDGTVREERFTMPEDGSVKLLQDQKYSSGQVSYINDDMGIHRLSNVTDNRSMSLHLYVGPIDQCRVFDKASGEYEWKELEYDTVATEV